MKNDKIQRKQVKRSVAQLQSDFQPELALGMPGTAVLPSISEIKRKRLRFGISQSKLAEASGISPVSISIWESGKSVPLDRELALLVSAVAKLAVSISDGSLNIKKKRIVRSSKPLERPKVAAIGSPQEYQRKVLAVQPPCSDYVAALSEFQSLASCPRRANAPKAISLFSGCGGMDLGFKAAGVDIKGHVEIDGAARRIYKANFPESEELGTDICSITDDEIESWRKRFGEIDIVIGGPPCQGFSLAGKRDPNDVRNQLYRYYVKIVSMVRPKFFVMENVRQLTTLKDTNGALFIDRIVDEFSSKGYSLSVNEINAAAYGVPQSRERLVIVGVRTGLMKGPFAFPSAQFSYSSSDADGVLHRSGLPAARTFRDATEGLAPLESGQASRDPLHWTIAHPLHVINWLKDVPEGHSAHENADPALRPPSGFNTTYKRIRWDEPCSTISTNFNMISGCRNVHPVSTRALTIREATRAQSFPDQFAFFGSWSDVRRVIGNAVPPLLAKAVADAIIAQGRLGA